MSLPNDVRTAREDLAAALRWAARLGWQSGICNHFSLMVPGRDDLFLVNPEGFFWSEVTASGLLVCTLDGDVVEGEGTVERTAFSLHAPIHRRHPAARAVFHTHMPHATAICMLEDGRIEPVVQEGLQFHGRVAYDDRYNGLAMDVAEGERVAAILGDAEVLMLRSHGPFVVGPTAADALDRLYYLEQHCRLQLLAMGSGRPVARVPEAIAGRVAADMRGAHVYVANHLAAVKRVLDRESPDWRS